MQTRNHDWYDSENNRPMFGIQVKAGDSWRNAAENGKPCIYSTEAERDSKRAELRKRKAA